MAAGVAEAQRALADAQSRLPVALAQQQPALPLAASPTLLPRAPHVSAWRRGPWALLPEPLAPEWAHARDNGLGGWG
ncbi:hypothetical protein AB1Y20_007686 [Prymnesium parvum]|uniref:Uncharacterized protein n=1 Tax=Prymnesium parvum TaxID=97485 RepID=A0AB34IXX0_PRYPA